MKTDTERNRLISQGATTIHPVSKLPQTPDQVRAERDLLLMSQSALLAEVKRLKTLSRGRLQKIRKVRLGTAS